MDKNLSVNKKTMGDKTMPQEWSTAIICPLHKKCNKLECSNYRGISLLNVTYNSNKLIGQIY
jgi:hypothetical protein